MWCRSSPPTISKTVLYYASFAVDLHNDPTRCSVMDIVLVVNSRTDHQTKCTRCTSQLSIIESGWSSRSSWSPLTSHLVYGPLLFWCTIRTWSVVNKVINNRTRLE